MQEYHSNNKTSSNMFRIKVYVGVVFILFGVLVTRLWYLQVIQGHKFWVLSEENRIRLLRVKAPRGVITDADGFVLVRNRPSFNVFVIPEVVQMLEKKDPQLLGAMLGKLQAVLPMPKEQILEKVKQSRRPKFEPVSIFQDANLKTVAYLEEHKLELPGVLVEVEPLRYNIYDTVASHVVGYLGEITEAQLKQKEMCPDCVQGDLIGQYGIENSFNRYLTGKTGGRQVEVNAYGRELQTLSRQDPEPGNNITLTINLHIQLIAEEALGNSPGAIVAINPQNGQILAMVSRPAFNPNLFAGGISTENWRKIEQDPNKPLQNKTMQSTYAPGSTFKIPVGSALLQNGVVKKGTQLHCTGSVNLAKTTKKCWKAGGHGSVSIREAIEQSCNVFFYRAGLELGIDELARYTKSFGFGARTGIELPDEKPGLIPTRQWKQETIGDRWYPSETMDAAIGQGFISVTPLQMANMTAAVANGGTLYKPTLVKKITEANGDSVEEYTPTVIRQVPIDPGYLKLIREGMWMVVNGDHGTARGSKLKDFQFAGKTGTAQVVGVQKGVPKELPEYLRDHAWFICFAPIDNPQIAMAILVEHGEGGAKSAAPVAKYIFERLYLPQEYVVKGEDTEPGI